MLAQLETLFRQTRDLSYQIGTWSDYLDRAQDTPAQKADVAAKVGAWQAELAALQPEFEKLLDECRTQQPAAFTEWISAHLAVVTELEDHYAKHKHRAHFLGKLQNARRGWQALREGQSSLPPRDYDFVLVDHLDRVQWHVD